jgi:hypothetical protein
MRHAEWLLEQFAFEQWMPRPLLVDIADKNTPDPRVLILNAARDYSLGMEGLATMLQKIAGNLKKGRRRKGHWGYVAGAVACECENREGRAGQSRIVAAAVAKADAPPELETGGVEIIREEEHALAQLRPSAAVRRGPESAKGASGFEDVASILARVTGGG